MGITFRETPELFGIFHIGFVIAIALFSVPFFLFIRNKKEENLLRFLHVSGIIMLIAEVWKQWFSYVYVYDHSFSMWFFPWQLCSMAMYCCASLPYLNEKRQNTVLVFLSTYSFLAAIMALAVPADMLRPQILLTWHGFLYHGLMILESLTAMIIVRRRKASSFTSASVLFLLMAAIAEIINILSHMALHNTKIEPNMFNITPYYASTQPVFHEIAVALGIIPEILIYLSCIILMSWIFFLLEKTFLTEK